MGSVSVQERHAVTSGLAHVLHLLEDWTGCLAMVTPEVSHLPAGVGCYFGQVKY